jgi:hypothetical protein
VKLLPITVHEPSGNLTLRWMKADGRLHAATIRCGDDITACLGEIDNHMRAQQLRCIDASCYEEVKAAAAKVWTSRRLAAVAEQKQRDQEEFEQTMARRESEKAERAASEEQKKTEFNAAVDARVRAVMAQLQGEK